jgi:Mrp family chromosome partitioning ATPase
MPEQSPPTSASHTVISDPDPAAAGVLRAVRAHPVMLIVSTLAALVAAAAWLAVRSPTYEATAEILVTPAPDDGGPDRSLPLLRTSGDRTRIVQTAASLVDSAQAAALTQKAMGDAWTPARVADAVDVEPVGQTDVLAVTARDGDRRVAMLLANGFARAALDARAQALSPRFAALIQQLEEELRRTPDTNSALAVDLAEQLSELRALRQTGDPTLSLSRTAEMPASAVRTSPSLILLLALLAGAVVGLATALIAELWGPARVNDADEASAVAGGPVLARVPAGRRGQGDPPAAVAAALRSVQLQLDASEPPAQVVLMASASPADEAPGCVNDFARVLAAQEREVLVVDLDGSTEGVGAQLEAASPALNERALATVIGVRGLYVITAGGRTTAAGDVELDLTSLLSQARERFDYVLVSAPPLAQSGEALQVIHAVDAVLLVVRLRRTVLEDLRTAVGLLQRTRGRVDGLLVLSGRLPRRHSSVPDTVARSSEPEAPTPSRAPRTDVHPRLGGIGERADRSS